ncbi:MULTISPECIES: nucleotidyltransferase family protein [Agrobacterium]|uniref:Nucleotidyltransferase family protein n=1 Tax=Agrobacterium tumefaciens TaxID=358 RepID=A0AAF0GZM4_AGRTU|nr:MULTISPECIES: nucleotidyltransferase family protein [Agrobacterium]WGM61756.1 nucleotidyltransferase family protein [Agrobacterium tumefaciens]CVI64251.1 conserved hypothetical protein [Agrobacterium salinitolerans str. Hayward 0363]
MTLSFQGELESIVLASPLLAPIIDAWNTLALPDSWIAAGAIAQTIWNHKFGLPPAHGVADVDIIYFDPHDLTETGEAEHATRIRSILTDLPVRIDVKNEARVHIWYENKFGHRIVPYSSSTDAIESFPTTATAIGLRPERGRLQINAPFGLNDLMTGIVRPNKRQISQEIYKAKVERWIAIWSDLSVIAW